GGALRPVPHGGAGKTAPITLSFTHQRGAARLAGFAGCNNYSGQYTIANGLLIVTAPPVSTRMACANADLARLEQDYLAGLTAVTASRLDHDTRPQRLTLALRSGDVLDFARRADPL
ncbi:META domain-containing protein, partial [Bordetella pertussis]